jgi:pyruvate/2-oxoglutarate dehydrogenase complex dihydrolipoamide acyltransferase (E2) component
MIEAVAVLVPQLNPNDEHAVLVCWHVTSGAWVEAEQVLATVETTKATYDIDAPVAGYAFFEQAPRSLVAVGAPIAWISESSDWPQLSTASAKQLAAQVTGPQPRFSRKALKVMRQHGLNPSDFLASGRVEVADVEQRIAERSAAVYTPPADADEVEMLEQTPAKVLEVARLAAVYEQAIPSTVVVPVSSADLDARLRSLAERVGPLSLLELAIHDVARTLGAFPELNGFYADGRATRYTSVRIGFAINAGKGLRVPVVQDADTLSYAEVAESVRDLSLRYIRGELTAADVAKGTFTITDLSSQGVVHFVPVLNFRQAAILGLCAERPGTGQRDLVLTFDHRMADGMQAATFLLRVREQLTGESVD